MLIYSAIVLLMLFILLKEKQKFIFYIPFLLQFADISKIFIAGGALGKINILLDFTLVIVSLAVVVFIIIQNISFLRKNTYGIFILLIYLLIMVMYSTDVWWSFKRYLNVALTFMILPATLIIVKDMDDIKRIIKPAIWLIIIFLVNISISTSLKLQTLQEGFSYINSFIYLGSVNFFSVFGFVYALIIIPFAFYLNIRSFNKYFLLILYFAGLFVLILLLKRTYIYLALAGPLIFMFFLSKKRNIRFIGQFFIIGLISYLIASDYILAAFDFRGEAFTRTLEEEGRSMELILYPEVAKYSSDPTNFMLFGKELFNSLGKFTLIENVLHDKNRMLHTDIATILYGAGIIGLFLFLRMYYFILKKYLYLRNALKKTQQDEITKKMYVAFVSIFICLVINMFSDGMIVATNRVLPYMMLGAILGVMQKRFNSQVNNFSNTRTPNV